MNLITRKWIPVLHKDGKSTYITPDELTIQIDDNPITKLNTARADFNGSLIQFLIGLLQTTLPNLRAKQWREWYAQPPSSPELKAIFAPFEPNFNLFGDGPRFLQDLTLTEESPQPAAALLIEQPGQQTIKQNADHFIKRNHIQQLCPGCAATALFTLQTNAPAGGSGHRTSMRGGGPLTTLVISDRQEKQSLWHTLWLNVLTRVEFEEYIKPSLGEAMNKTIFPWNEPTITSENNRQVHVDDVHPFQMYWSMPRCIRLLPNDKQLQPCSLCGIESEITVSEYVTKNYGANYSEHWRHTLSPYLLNKDNQSFPMHPQPGGIGYKHWFAISLKHPAFVVKANQQRLANREQALGTSEPGSEIKIWAFGYDMDNMKARCWYENYMPFYNIPLEQVEKLSPIVDQFIRTTEQARLYLNAALNTCKVPTAVANQQLWQQTESKFYSLLSRLIHFAEENADTCKREWLNYIKEQSLAIFDRLANLNYPELKLYQDHVQAREKLKYCFNGKAILKILTLNPQ